MCGDTHTAPTYNNISTKGFENLELHPVDVSNLHIVAFPPAHKNRKRKIPDQMLIKYSDGHKIIRLGVSQEELAQIGGYERESLTPEMAMLSFPDAMEQFNEISQVL